jgi:hypothetical protein
MLYLSLEYERAAREYYHFPSDIITLFIIEYNSPAATLELVASYPFDKVEILRKKKFGLSKNILLGLKEAFNLTDDFVIHLEDDILLHYTYFQYMDILLNMNLNFSVLSPYNGDDAESVNMIYKGHHYAALAPLIDKEFFEDYIKPCITSVYYENFNSRDKFVRALAKKYQDNKLYKYRNGGGTHNEQAGLINRLVDVALIEENKHVILPYVNRQQHIGYFGKNRPGGTIPGRNFEERLSNLRNIIKDPATMYKLSATKQYNDYLSFSPKLEEWDGTLAFKR